MKILVYGSQGWIGQQFVQILEDKKANFYKGTSRVDSEKDILSEIETISPTHVVSFIGRTHGKIGEKVYTTIDYLEQ